MRTNSSLFLAAIAKALIPQPSWSLKQFDYTRF